MCLQERRILPRGVELNVGISWEKYFALPRCQCVLINASDQQVALFWSSSLKLSVKNFAQIMPKVVYCWCCLAGALLVLKLAS